jgi:hypothetical protein
MHHSLNIHTVQDRRGERPSVVGLYEVNRYLFIPVDLMIATKNSLADEVFRTLGGAGNKPDSLGINLVIDEFDLSEKTSSWFFPHYRLNASMRLFRESAVNDSECIGELAHEIIVHKPLIGATLKNGFEKALRKWQGKCITHLTKLFENQKLCQPITLGNFRTRMYQEKRIHMICGSDMTVTPDGRLIDGAVFFSHREVGRCYFRSGGYHLRYRMNRTWESIEFGLSTDYLFYRFHHRALLRIKSQLMIGLNQWKDIATQNHTLYDAFIGEWAFSQTVLFDPQDRRSIVFGIGLMESVYYIYSKDVRLETGIIFHLGVKL